MDAVLRIESLVKTYDKVNAVDGISFVVEKGACFGLLGPNGAGKTTTIEIIEGLIKPTSGEIWYGEQKLVGDKKLAAEMTSKIGIQFQHTALQDFLTVKETLKLFASFYPKPFSIEQLIDDCELDDFLDRDNRSLSGGQRQRLLLALALINDPEIVFLDEPTTGLDPHARRQFWQLVNKIKSQGKTVILTTHYMDEAQQLCDTIVIMDKGKIIEQGTPDDLLTKHFKEVSISLPIANVASSLLQNMLNEGRWQQVGERVEIGCEDVEQGIHQLVKQGVVLEGLQVKSANLDDLFLKLTGSKLN